MNRPQIAALTVLAVAGWGACEHSTAAALPACTGNQQQQQAPYTCVNTRTIDGTAVTVVVSEIVSGLASATFTFDTPRTTDSLIRLRSHEGISSSGIVTDPTNMIPAGSVGPVTLTLQAFCGQLDVKAIFTTNGDKRGAVAGPYIDNDTCLDTQIVPSPTTAPTPAVSLSPSPLSPATGGGGTPSIVTVASGRELPATGINVAPFVLGAIGCLLLGLMIVAVARQAKP